MTAARSASARPAAAPQGDTAPRYTSYPTSPHFHAGIGADAIGGWMAEVGEDEPLSLYVHVPFCDRLCWFCACHTTRTLRYDPVADYLGHLHREIDLVAGRLGGRGRVRALHLGGGSPTMLTPDDLRRLAGRLKRAFRFDADAAISIEIDPNDMDADRLRAVADIGTTRASLGVQDFDPAVQEAINREQSFERTRSVAEGLRAHGVAALNLDLVYGLPHQTVAGVGATVEKCLELAPDRFAIFGYAHVPWFKKHQTLIDEAVLPGPAERLEQAARAAEAIVASGYERIGLDHFARPADSLAAAARSGLLRRNFQGYTDDACETLVGLGPSSVSRFRQGYAQNQPAMGAYARAVAAEELPVARGMELSDDDRARAWVIERLMCDFGFSASGLRARAGPAARRVLADAATIAAREPGILAREGDRYAIPAKQRPFVRSIAARFDAYLADGKARHSAAV